MMFCHSDSLPLDISSHFWICPFPDQKSGWWWGQHVGRVLEWPGNN